MADQGLTEAKVQVSVIWAVGKSDFEGGEGCVDHGRISRSRRGLAEKCLNRLNRFRVPDLESAGGYFRDIAVLVDEDPIGDDFDV